MQTRAFQNLIVWQRSRALAIDVCRAASGKAFSGDWGLRDQLRKSAVSVPSNIAEGNERGSDRDTTRFFFIARGSLAELATQADIACELGLLGPDQAKSWITECDELARMLAALIARRKSFPER
ncbi:MAG TPA: four helix bundle protein [Usitatibacter sp.]|nr:four helix bundle protein [Usitatibacter sp.]